MSPQFVDFNADGHIDIVAGIFDGSPHVALGSAKGYAQPVQILDQDGQRIVLNRFWNFDTEKWDETKRCDPPTDGLPKGHGTSAFAWDIDADGDLDLLLGDYDGGALYLRRNEGTATAAKFATRNQPVLAGGKPLLVPHKMATPRVLDFDRDGLQDLVIGSMGDAYGTSAGGAVFVYANTGTNAAPAFGQPSVLVAASAKGASEPTRPDSGLYMDLADHDGDDDLDLLVGGYSLWSPPARELSAEETERARQVRLELGELNKQLAALSKVIVEATKGLDAEAVIPKRTEILRAQAPERTALGKKQAPLQAELDTLVPGPKRVSYVWLYENHTKSAAPAAPGSGGGK